MFWLRSKKITLELQTLKKPKRYYRSIFCGPHICSWELHLGSDPEYFEKDNYGIRIIYEILFFVQQGVG